MIEPDIVIRPEQPEDTSAVRGVDEAAFGRPAEADLVAALHAAGDRLPLGAEGSRRAPALVRYHAAFSDV